jgi:hypothetical protein
MHWPRSPGKCAEGSAPAATGALTLAGVLSVAGVIGSSDRRLKHGLTQHGRLDQHVADKPA